MSRASDLVMLPMEQQTCATCPAFLEPVGPNRFGECRRRAPEAGRGFPSVKPEDWCGEHPRRAAYFAMELRIDGAPSDPSFRERLDALRQELYAERPGRQL